MKSKYTFITEKKSFYVKAQNALCKPQSFHLKQALLIVIVLGFNDTSTLVGHFVSSPREREKRDSRRDEREEQ